MTCSAEAVYDQVPYHSYTVRQSHPDNLATIGGILGLNTPAVETCRVLELGCAKGGNIIPMAYNLPNGEFVGIDVSSVQIEMGQRLVDELDIKNIKLIHGSIADIGPDFGTFDYIIAHGVLSWVAPEVREMVYAVSKQNLAPNGIAYISYNTYPGWHMPEMLREMLLLHTASLEAPEEKIKQARILIDFLHMANDGKDTAYSHFIQSERELLSHCPDSYLFHEHLADTNDALYFHQFVEAADRHGLQYVSDVEIIHTFISNFPPEIAKFLRRFDDVLKTEQYIDFVLNRRFRHSLVCHADVPLNRTVSADAIKGCAVAARVVSGALEANMFNDEAVTLTLSGVADATINGSAMKVALHLLSRIYPRALGYDDLVAEIEAFAENAGDPLAQSMAEHGPAVRYALASSMLQLYCAGHIELHHMIPDMVTEVSDRPTVSPLVRVQARDQEWVTSQWHARVSLNPTRRAIVQCLDGAHSRRDVEMSVGKLPAAGESIDEALEAIAQFGLLTA